MASFIEGRNYGQFLRLLSLACGLRPRLSEESLWPALQAAYCSPPRFYHTLEHALACVRMGDEMRTPAIGVMALLYHDAHYVAGSAINEEESASLLQEHYSDWQYDFAGKPQPHPIGPSSLEKIRRLILATKHIADPSDSLEAAVMDIDMSILGAELPEFNAYEMAIRDEYAYLPDDVYKKGRATFLGGLLRKEQIYYNAMMRHRFEKKARDNITRLIFRLCDDAKTK